MDKNSRKEDAVQLAVKFGLRKEEAEDAYEGMLNQIKTSKK